MLWMGRSKHENVQPRFLEAQKLYQNLGLRIWLFRSKVF